MASFTITMTRSKETKGTFVYTEDDDSEGQPPRVGTLYLKKWAANSLGEKITVNVTGTGPSESSIGGGALYRPVETYWHVSDGATSVAAGIVRRSFVF